MKKFRRLVHDKCMDIVMLLKKKGSIGSIAEMLCFLLGVYGERAFLHIYSFLGKISPEMFCFMGILFTYLAIIRFIHN